jgi:YD repeat-containing protein
MLRLSSRAEKAVAKQLTHEPRLAARFARSVWSRTALLAATLFSLLALAPADSMAAGTTSKAPGPIVEKYTTANSDTYRLPNGHMLTHVFEHPVNYLDSAGKWEALSGTQSEQSAATMTPDVERNPLGQENETACTLTSTTPTSTACNELTFKAGYETSSKAARRALVQFVLPDLHEEETILSAQLELYAAKTTTTTGVAMGAYRVTTPWTTGATWNTTNGSTVWHTPGGDYANPEKESDAAINSSVGAKTGWTYWYPTQMVQEWYNGTDAPNEQGQPDLGFLLKDVTEGATNNVVTFDGREEREHAPGLTLEWVQRGVGNATNYTQLPMQLSSTQSLDVNPASGNLSIHSTDLQIPSKGLAFESTRTWNSLRNEDPDYGYGWVDGNAVYVEVLAGGNVAYTDGSGHTSPFIKEGSEKFRTPSGIEATMCEAKSASPCPTTLPSGVTYQLIYSKTGERVNFGHKEVYEPFVYYYVVSVEDSSGDKQTAHYTGSLEYPTSWTDTEGTEIAYTESASKGYTKITDVGNSHSTSYTEPVGEDGLPHLTEYFNENKEKTTYRYGGESYLEGNLLTEITEPSGNVTKLTYNSDYQITKIERIPSGQKTGSSTTYTYYELGKAPAPCASTQKATVVSETGGSEETPALTYCSNVLDEVEIINEKEPAEMPIEPGEEIEDPQEEGEPGIEGEGDVVADSLKTTGICAPTSQGYSAACIEATERSTPRAPTTESTSLAGNPLKPALVASYQIYIQHTSKYALWGTIRRNKQSYVLGNARNGWHFAKQEEHEAGGAADLGTIGSGYKGCGWVYADHVGSKNIGNEPSSCEHTSGSKNGSFEPPPSAFSSSLDCKACREGHYVKLEHVTPVCLNVSPLNKPESSTCNDVDPAKPELKPTKTEQEGKTTPQVKWRYVTREGRWVLVEIPSLGIAEGKEAFLPRSALPKTLPTYSN